MQSRRDRNVLNTYRYLRMGLVALGALLLTSVLWQVAQNGCAQMSISAYYYTPARGVFVAALAAVGASLIIYQGDSTTEDVLLNFTGAAAFVIAFVPTGIDTHCTGSSNIPSTTDIANAASNNIWSVLIVAAVAVVLARLVNRETFAMGDWSVWAKVWFGLTCAVLAFGAVEFVFFRTAFIHHAHDVAAGSLFAGLILVVCSNALTYREIKRAQNLNRWYHTNWYAVLAVIMVLTTAAIAVVRLWIATDWRHAVFTVEFSVIGEFMAFWMLQTWRLWSVVAPSDELLPD
jgi:hypothetical protein